MPKRKGEVKPDSAPHAPRYRYDCGRCKFSWCCGTTCACNLKKKDHPEPPNTRKLQVAQDLWDWRNGRDPKINDHPRPASLQGVAATWDR